MFKKVLGNCYVAMLLIQVLYVPLATISCRSALTEPKGRMRLIFQSTPYSQTIFSETDPCINVIRPIQYLETKLIT